MESTVIKIHPTLQTKEERKRGRMQERESIGECVVVGEGLGLSLHRSLNSPNHHHLPSKRLHLSRRAVILLPWGWMDGWKARGKKREGGASSIQLLFPPMICRGSLKRGSTIDSITRQTLEGCYTSTQRGSWSSRAGWRLLFSPPLLSTGKCLPLFRCPLADVGPRTPQIDSSLFSPWTIPSPFSMKSRRKRRNEEAEEGLDACSLSSFMSSNE